MESSVMIETLRTINGPNQISPLSQILEAEKIYSDMVNTGLIEKRKYNLKSVGDFGTLKVKFNVPDKNVS